jgi:hypothetical protein
LIGIAPGVVGVTYMVSDGNSVYNSLQTSLEKRFRGGLGFMASYTWSHSIDNVVNAFGGADNGPFPQDIRCRNCDRGNSGFDLRHRFITSMNYALPFGKGRKFDSSSKVINAIAGGWDANLIFTRQTGLPFTPVLQTSVSNAGGSRPMRFGNGKLDNPDRARWFDTSFNTSGAVWGVPATFTFGNAGRNILYGPGRTQVDWSMFKDFSMSEKWKLQYRAEFFNLFNTPQFDLPNPSIGNANAGVITALVGPNRQIQMGLRFSF